MRHCCVALALLLIASSAAGAAQQDRAAPRQINREVTNPIRHTYDPAKLKITERTVADKDSPTGEAKVWRVVTDTGLILGTLSTKAEAEVALDAAKKFTTMVIVGNGPRKFTYFDR